MSVTSPALADGFFTSSTTWKPEGLGRQRCSQSPPQVNRLVWLMHVQKERGGKNSQEASLISLYKTM